METGYAARFMLRIIPRWWHVPCMPHCNPPPLTGMFLPLCCVYTLILTPARP